MKEITYNKPNGKNDTKSKVVDIMSRRKEKSSYNSMINTETRNEITNRVILNYGLFGNSGSIQGSVIKLNIEKNNIVFGKQTNFILNKDNTIVYYDSEDLEIVDKSSNIQSILLEEVEDQFGNTVYYNSISLDFIKTNYNYSGLLNCETMIEEQNGNESTIREYNITGNNKFNILASSKSQEYSIIILYPRTRTIPVVRFYSCKYDDIEIFDILNIYDNERVDFNSTSCLFDMEISQIHRLSSVKNTKCKSGVEKAEEILNYLKHEKVITDSNNEVIGFENDFGLSCVDTSSKLSHDSKIMLRGNLIGGQKITTHNDGTLSKVISYNSTVIDYDKQETHFYTEGKNISILPDNIIDIHNKIGELLKDVEPCNFEFYKISNNHYVISYKSKKHSDWSAQANIYNDCFNICYCDRVNSDAGIVLYDIDGSELMSTITTSLIAPNNVMYVTHKYTDINGLLFVKKLTMDSKGTILSLDYSSPELAFSYDIGEDGNVILNKFESSLYSLQDDYIYIRDEYGIPRKFNIH